MKYIPIFLLIVLFACTKKQDSLISGETMGTTYHIKYNSVDLSQDELRLFKVEIDSVLVAFNNEMSNWISTSEISKFNQLSDTSIFFPVSPNFYNVVKRSNEIAAESGGAFDITVSPLVNAWGFGWKGKQNMFPSARQIDSIKQFIGYQKLSTEKQNYLKKHHANLKIDLNAIAPGYACDILTIRFKNRAIKNFFIEIGGEVYCEGLNSRDEQWTIGIETPNYGQTPGESFEKIISVSNKAVATSGNYRKYYMYNNKIISHAIDPNSGYPADHKLASITIITNNCMDADGYATAIMVLGEEKGFDFVNSNKNLEAYFIIREDSTSYSEKISNNFKQYILE